MCPDLPSPALEVLGAGPSSRETSGLWIPPWSSHHRPAGLVPPVQPSSREEGAGESLSAEGPTTQPVDVYVSKGPGPVEAAPLREAFPLRGNPVGLRDGQKAADGPWPPPNIHYLLSLPR